MKKILVLMTAFAVMAIEPAFAYTGPGLGAGAIALVVGFFSSIFIALFAVIWYPVKRLLKKRRKSAGEGAAIKSGNDEASLNVAKPDGDVAGKTAE